MPGKNRNNRSHTLNLSQAAEILECISDGFFALDREWRFIYVNNRAASNLGYTPQELIGQNIWEKLPKLIGTAHEFNYRKTMMDGKTREFEIQQELTNLFYNLRVYPCGEGISVYWQDISDRKQAKEVVLSQKRILETIIGNTEAQLAYLDSRFNFVLVNTAYEKSSGYKASELIGKNHFTLFPNPENQKIFEKVRTTGQPVTFKQKPFEYPEQAERDITYWDWTLIPVKDDNGQVQGLVLSLVDVTGHKETEEALKRYAADLEAVNKEMETFSYSVSHDLRQPLRALGSFSELLLEDYKGKLDETGKDYLNRVVKASQHMSRLTDDILKLSQVTRTELHQGKVNLSEIAESISSELQDSQPERKAEIKIPCIIIARGDKALLTTAMKNLLENAWKFTRKCRLTRIEMGMLEKDGEKIYYIKDNGAGFDMQYQNQLFQPFQRLHTSKDYPGTGIGLSIVQRVINRHGGKIWAESQPEKGTTIYFTLSD